MFTQLTTSLLHGFNHWFEASGNLFKLCGEFTVQQKSVQFILKVLSIYRVWKKNQIVFYLILILFYCKHLCKKLFHKYMTKPRIYTQWQTELSTLCRITDNVTSHIHIHCRWIVNQYIYQLNLAMEFFSYCIDC